MIFEKIITVSKVCVACVVLTSAFILAAEQSYQPMRYETLSSDRLSQALAVAAVIAEPVAVHGTQAQIIDDQDFEGLPHAVMVPVIFITMVNQQ